MLDEDEWSQIEPLLVGQLKNIKSYRAKHDVGLKEATDMAFKPATDKYFELTGFNEENYAAIYHHRRSLFGSKCEECSHLYRTNKASFCANCGSTQNANT